MSRFYGLRLLSPLQIFHVITSFNALMAAANLLPNVSNFISFLSWRIMNELIFTWFCNN